MGVLAVGCAEAESDDPTLGRAALPEVELCDRVRDWPEAWARDEQAAIDFIKRRYEAPIRAIFE